MTPHLNKRKACALGDEHKGYCLGTWKRTAQLTFCALLISDDDRKAVLEVLSDAQFVYGLSRYPKKQVLDDPADVKALRERLEAIRAAAKGLSAAQRAKVDVPWADLEAIDSGTEAVWKAAKRATPKIIAELTPLVRDEPEAAFLIAPMKRGRESEIEPQENVKETPKEKAKASAQGGLTGKEIAGLELVIQQRIAADETYLGCCAAITPCLSPSGEDVAPRRKERTARSGSTSRSYSSRVR